MNDFYLFWRACLWIIPNWLKINYKLGSVFSKKNKNREAFRLFSYANAREWGQVWWFSKLKITIIAACCFWNKGSGGMAVNGRCGATIVLPCSCVSGLSIIKMWGAETIRISWWTSGEDVPAHEGIAWITVLVPVSMRKRSRFKDVFVWIYASWSTALFFNANKIRNPFLISIVFILRAVNVAIFMILDHV